MVRRKVPFGRVWRGVALAVVVAVVGALLAVIPSDDAAAATALVPYEATGWSYAEYPTGSVPSDWAATSFSGATSTGAAPFGSGPAGSCALPASDPAVTSWSGAAELVAQRTIAVPANATRLTISLAVADDVQVAVNGTNLTGDYAIDNACPTRGQLSFDVPAALFTNGVSNTITLRARSRGALSYLDAEVSVEVGATFLVNDGGDAADSVSNDGVCLTAAGTCTLRAAIAAANALAGHDRITFGIGSAPATVALTSELPALTGSVNLDATTQTGFDAATAAPAVWVNPQFVGGTAVLRLAGGSSLVRGLAIGPSNTNGIHLATGVGNRVEGNWIGLDTAGNDRPNTGAGVEVWSTDNRIGGAGPFGRNVIAGNGRDGVFIVNPAHRTVVRNNHIGDMVPGGPSTGNDGTGIYVLADDAVIRDNVISGNGGDGLRAYAWADGFVVQGNRIGLTPDGTSYNRNLGNGIELVGVGGAVIGGAALGQGNAITGNYDEAIRMTSANEVGQPQSRNTIIRGNVIGTDPAGNALPSDVNGKPNRSDGIFLSGAADNQIGGLSAGAGNVISGNGGAGISAFLNATRTRIEGNRIGTNAAATTAVGNTGDGVELFSADHIVGGTSAAARNVISGNGGSGVFVGGGSIRVLGNVIGTTASGDAALPNGIGVTISSATGSTSPMTGVELGGANASARNLISGNTNDGVQILSPGHESSLIHGNWIGLGADGTTPVPNGTGVRVRGSGWTIGGSGVGQANVVSANTGAGVVVGRTNGSADLTSAAVVGNRIGTDSLGLADRGNGGSGVVINTSNVTIGPANVISGNAGDGVHIDRGDSPGTGILIRGNSIGTNATRILDLGNDGAGVNVHRATGAIVGGRSDQGEGNFIAGNAGSGVAIGLATAEVIGNSIGRTGLANARGVDVGFGGAGVIGTLDLGEANVISANAAEGVRAPSSPATLIRANSISANGAAGITVTSSSPARPVISSATATSTHVTVSGSYTNAARPNQSIDVDIFASAACDGTSGEGERYLGSILVVTNGSGVGPISGSIAATGVAHGSVITATATAHTSQSTTSAFSDCVSVAGLPGLAVGDAAVTEGASGDDRLATFTVTLTGTPTGDVMVDYATADGDASAPSDYTAASGTLVFSAAGSQTVSVTVPGDDAPEDDETFHLDVSSTSGAAVVVTDGRGTATITSDDRLPRFSVEPSATLETSGEDTELTFAIRLSDPAPAGGASVEYSLTPGSALPNVDYTPVSGTATVPAGQTLASVFVPVIGDFLDEDDETLTLVLGATSAGTVAGAPGTGTIVDDDATPTVTIATAVADEGNSGTTMATFTAVLDAVSGRDARFDWATADGTALAAADYLAASGQLTIPAGVTSATFEVPVVGDTLDELTEWFHVNLSAPSNVRFGATQASASIRDDDGPPPAFVVNSAGDGSDVANDGLCQAADGTCTLRAAITEANRTPATDTIAFGIGTGVAILTPSTFYPVVSAPAVLDATTQPGYAGSPLVRIFASGLTGNGVINIGAGPSAVRGFSIGPSLSSGVRVSGGTGTVLTGNWVGVAPDGERAQNAYGISVDAPGNVIGGPGAGERNLIAGNLDYAVHLEDGAEGTLVHHNTIGNTDTSKVRPNSRHGVNVAARNVVIRNNVIAGNQWAGINLEQHGDGARIEGNLIGLREDGQRSIANGWDGIRFDGADDAVIGGTTPAQRNVISGVPSDYSGIRIARRFFVSPPIDDPAVGNRIIGNYIGTTADGTARPLNSSGFAGGNEGHGISVVDSDSNAIGGTAPGEGNLVSGNAKSGISVSGSQGVSIRGNRVGTNAAGDAAVANATGIDIHAGEANVVGGQSSEARNVVSGNGVGILLRSNRSIVEGNYVGTDISGTAAIPNRTGIRTEGPRPNPALAEEELVGAVIGGATAASRNIIAGNTAVAGGYPDAGITLAGVSSGVRVQGNWVGLGANGNPLPNATGISATGRGYTIGGRSPGTANVVSGNASATAQFGYGIHLSGVANTAEGNLVGTDPTGTMDLGNGRAGVYVGYHVFQAQAADGEQNVVGGSATGAGNLIAGNDGWGVEVGSALFGKIEDTVILGNRIGVAADGSSPLGNALGGIQGHASGLRTTIGSVSAGNVIAANGGPGVRVVAGHSTLVVRGNTIGRVGAGNNGAGIDVAALSSSVIGGTAAGEGNAIGGNSGDGIVIPAATALPIRGNSFTSNGGLGIDVAPDGAAAASTVPSITSAGADATSISVQGSFTGSASTTYAFDVFASPACDDSLRGEGDRYLGATSATTNGSGASTFALTANAAVPHGWVVTATATDPAGRTSELGPCASVTGYSGLTLDDVAVAEGNAGTTPVTVTLRLSPAPSVATTVYVSTSNGSAVASDYQGGASVPVNFAPGATTATAGFLVNGDVTPEDDEAFFVDVVSSPAHVAVVDGRAVVTITTDDPLYQLSIDPGAAALEGSLDGGVLSFVVRLNRPAPGPVQVDFAVVDGSATSPEDYSAPSPGTLTFSSGEVEELVTLTLAPDLLDELDETVGLQLSNASGAVVMTPVGTGTIIDDDEPPVVSVPNVTVIEADAGSTVATFTATRPTVSGREASFSWATVDASATAPGDYASSSGTVTFAPGELSRTFTVSVAADDVAEPNEWLDIALSAGAGVQLAGDVATLSITDDDRPAPTFIVNSTADTADASGNGVCSVGTATGGACTLRAAIQEANRAATLDTIGFAIPGDGLLTTTVSGSTPLPTLVHPVVVDGTTQPGWNGRPRVGVVANSLGFSVVLSVTGGSSTVRGLVLASTSGTGTGLSIDGNGNVVEGLLTSAVVPGVCYEFGAALTVRGDDNRVGGPLPGQRNVLAGSGVGVFNYGNRTIIQGNHIGDVSRTDDHFCEGGTGILVNSGSGSVIGGVSPGARNVIAGNDTHGIRVERTASAVTIMGNYVGLDVTGMWSVPNQMAGIRVIGADDVTIGGLEPGAGNVIGGTSDGGDGIEIVDSSSDYAARAEILGNRIGTTADGTARPMLHGTDDPWGVLAEGITLQATQDALVRGNVISGVRGRLNSAGDGYGIVVQDSFSNVAPTGTRIEGNLIGTDPTGTVAVPNDHGIRLNSGATLVGGTAPGAGNRIAGNVLAGIQVGWNNEAGSEPVIQGNEIGLSASGGPLPNGTGVHIDSNSATNGSSIGGTGAGEANTIAFNSGDGVHVDNGRRHRIRGNRIHSNGGLGIDIHNLNNGTPADGVTANDLSDTDAGPNDTQNFPVLTSASTGGLAGTVTGTLKTRPSETYDLDFYRVEACDPSGNGEADLWVGSAEVATDASGNGSFSASIPALADGGAVTATATRRTTGDTSELSACRATSSLPRIRVLDAAPVSEAAGPSVFTVELQYPPTDGSSVGFSYTAASGTATAGTDFTSVAGVETLSAATPSRTINVPVLNDCHVEPTETFSLSVTSSAVVVDGTGDASVTDAPLPTAWVEGGDAVEGDDLKATVHVSRSCTEPIALTWSTELVAGAVPAAPDVDFASTSGTVILTPGATSQLVSVPTLSDRVYEPADERVGLSIIHATRALIDSGSNSPGVLGDAPGVAPTLSIRTADAVDGPDGVALPVLQLSRPAQHAVNAHVWTTDQTAKEGIDYEPIDDVFTIPAGDDALPLPVNLFDGADDRLSFLISFDDVEGASVGASSAGVFLEPDAPPNDSPGSAFELSGVAGMRGGTTLGATDDVAGPRGVWFRWVAPAGPGSVSFQTRFTTFDPTLQVYDDADPPGAPLESSVDLPDSSEVGLSLVYEPGRAYLIAVAGAAEPKPGEVFALEWSTATAPVNDHVESPIIEGAKGATRVVLAGSTVEPDERERFDRTGSVWYAFDPDTAGIFELAVADVADSDAQAPVVDVFDAADVGTSLDTDPAPGRARVELSGATSLLVSVSVPVGSLAGDAVLTWVLRPTNDRFASPATLPGGWTGTSVGTTNVDASMEPSEPAHAGGTRSVWHAWTPTIGGRVTFRTVADFDTTLAAYQGTAVGALTARGSNNDEDPPGVFTSQLSFDAVPGATYRIAVGGTSGAAGPFTLTWAMNPCARTGDVLDLWSVPGATLTIGRTAPGAFAVAGSGPGGYAFSDAACGLSSMTNVGGLVVHGSDGDDVVRLDVTNGALSPGARAATDLGFDEIDVTLNLGGGTDTFEYVGGAVRDFVDPKPTGLRLNTDADVDVVTTTVERLRLYGNGGDDILVAGPGDDVLDGGEGNDSLSPGLGNDSVLGGGGSDSVDYSMSSIAVVVNVATGSSTGNGTDTLSGIENVYGSSGADQLTGDDGPNRFFGMAGDDVIDGGGGADFANGGAGIDTCLVETKTACE